MKSSEPIEGKKGQRKNNKYYDNFEKSLKFYLTESFSSDFKLDSCIEAKNSCKISKINYPFLEYFTGCIILISYRSSVPAVQCCASVAAILSEITLLLRPLFTLPGQ